MMAAAPKRKPTYAVPVDDDDSDPLPAPDDSSLALALPVMKHVSDDLATPFPSASPLPEPTKSWSEEFIREPITSKPFSQTSTRNRTAPKIFEFSQTSVELKDDPDKIQAVPFQDYENTKFIFATDLVILWPRLYPDNGASIPLSESSGEIRIVCGTREDPVKDTMSTMLTCQICFDLVTDGKTCPKSDCDQSICGVCFKKLS